MAVLLEQRRPAAAPGAPPPGARRRLAPGRLDDRLTGWLVTIGLTLLAFGLRLWQVGSPSGVVFDEVYYTDDAADLLDRGVEIDEKTDGPAFVVHPPLGKWLIAVGQAVFGRDEFGWRIAAVVAGSLTVLALVRVARRMTGSTLLGGLAGLLLALDGLHFTMSRISMLDVFLVAFLVAAFACLVADRDDGRRRLTARPAARRGPRLGVRPWQLAAGACLGAALATKWSAVYYLAALGLLALSWCVGARRTAGVRAPFRAALRRDLPPLALTLGAVPLLVYLASWAGWFAGEDGWDRQWTRGSGLVGGSVAALRSLWHYHAQVLDFHAGLSTPHPYDSSPWGWLVLARPVAYYYTGVPAGTGGCGADVAGGCSRAVLGIGTPAIWWAAVPALVVVLWLWVSRRDWRAAAVLTGVGAGLLPWFATPERTMFLFYALPALPFLILALVLTAGLVLGASDDPAVRRRLGALVVTAYAVLVIVNFFHLLPILTGELVPYGEWRDRMWFRSWI